LATIWTNLGELDKAIVLFGRLIELDPKNLSAYYNCAALYEKQGNLDAAIEKIRAAIKVDSDDTTLREALSRLLAAKANRNPSANIPSASPGQGLAH
jgi:tetratricopeptide (TPR) repeat protein